MRLTNASLNYFYSCCTDLCNNILRGAYGCMSDCLYDFDITPAYRKKGSDKIFVGMNIVILNLSHKLLGTGLKQKLEGLSEELPARYKQVMEALERHKIFLIAYIEKKIFLILQHFSIKFLVASIITAQEGQA